MALLAAIIFIGIFIFTAKFEKNDEMSEFNYMKAQAVSSTVMYYFFCIAAIVSALIFGIIKLDSRTFVYIISSMFFVIIGIQDIVIGIVFRRLEAE